LASFLPNEANISSAQPEKIMSMPTARPMNHKPEVGHCSASITPSATEIRPDATLQPQLENRTTVDPMARKVPPAMK
jgi:hypothetical protein